jgi:aminoglycoside 3-N-acetyltransferase
VGVQVINNLLKQYTPQLLLENLKGVRSVINEVRNTHRERLRSRKRKKFIQSLECLTEDDITGLLSGPFGIRKNDIVMIHTSMDMLKLNFPPVRLLNLLQDVVGEEGLLLFPSYPFTSASKFMAEGKPFDLKRTPTTAGLLSELARRTPGALRSLHPTKSVCVIGKNARDIISGHEKCEYPFDERSPYGSFINLNGKVIGLGVRSDEGLTILHCIEGVLREDFPVPRFPNTYYNWECIDYSGKAVSVNVIAYHYRGKPDYRRYMENYFPDDICYDFEEKRRPFFVCQSKLFLDFGVKLARQGITWYTFPERGVEEK